MYQTPFDIDFVRSQFPGLDTPWSLFDNAGGSQIAVQAIDRTTDYLRQTNVQHGASYELSRLAASRVEAGIEVVRQFLNVDESCEIVAGSSASQLLTNLSLAMRQWIRPGDEIIVTNLDHEANITPWLRLADYGAEIRFWKVNRDTLHLETEDLQQLLSPRTRLVCVTQTSNITGAIVSVRPIADLVHAAGAYLCVDGVAYAPHRLPDMAAQDADIYVYSQYKVYGPHVGMLYVRRALMEQLGNINHYFHAENLPYKLQPGGVVYELIAGICGVGDYLELISDTLGNEKTLPRRAKYQRAFDAVHAHEGRLNSIMISYLQSRDDVAIIGPAVSDPDVRVCTVSMSFRGMRAADVTRRLEQSHIAVRNGNFYAARLVESLGIDDPGGLVRVSLAHYNSADELDKLISVLDTCR